MRYPENERKSEQVTEEVEKEVIRQKEEAKEKRTKKVIAIIIVVLIAYLLGMATDAVIVKIKYQSMEKILEQELTDAISNQPAEESSEQEVTDAISNQSTEESSELEEADIINNQSTEENSEQEESDEYNDYDWGVIQMNQILLLKNDVITFYKSDDITDEQMEEFVEAYLNIVDVALRNDDITPEAINNYNEIIKEINLIDYDIYRLKSTGADYRRGLKGFVVANSYRQIAEYYKELIPEEKYESFERIVERNLYSVTGCENNIQIVIDYGRDLIQEYIGDPDEVLVSTEWRIFTGMPEK